MAGVYEREIGVSEARPLVRAAIVSTRVGNTRLHRFQNRNKALACLFTFRHDTAALDTSRPMNNYSARSITSSTVKAISRSLKPSGANVTSPH
jgi:hypothetical protein